MSTPITMPALSPTMEEGNLAKWHVKAGDRIEPGQVIAEIETDKATMEVEAVDEGVIAEILVPEGSQGVKVNTPIATLAGEGEAAKPANKEEPLQAERKEPSPPSRGRGQGEGGRSNAQAPDRLNAPHLPASSPQGGGGDAQHIRVRRTFLGLHALPPEFKDDRAAYVQLVADVMIPAIAAAGAADAVDAFCENIGFTADEVDYVFAAARQHGLDVKLHAEQLSNQHGAALAARYKALSADHLEYLDDAGIAAMAQSGTVAVLLPGAFYFLREKQLPPIEGLRKAGVHMAVASDCNPGTSPMTSPLAALNMACTLFRLTPEEALAGITREGARALGMLDDVGTLEQGKAADLAIWDINSPAELSYWLGAPLLRERVFAGRVV
jgi:pyruvate/2-oxoglutarate dehydrogenase complex dihydrolipoamide acyltransferase (E2) component